MPEMLLRCRAGHFRPDAPEVKLNDPEHVCAFRLGPEKTHPDAPVCGQPFLLRQEARRAPGLS